MKLNFIICTFNRSNILKKCIESILLDINSITDNECEILIIDNNSSDDTKLVSSELMKNNKNVFYYLEEKVGLSNARNRGIMEAKGDILIFLDDDTIVNRGYTRAVIDLFNDDNIVCGGGKIIPVWKSEKPIWFQDSFASIIGETTYGDIIRKMKKNEVPLGGNMIFRKKIFNEIGLFNSELGLKGNELYLGEENDICEKVRRAGKDIYYIANATVGHIVHTNKVNKEYILKRLTMEGTVLAKTEKLEKNFLYRFKNLILRMGIIIIRDIPNYLIFYNNNLKGFEKKCKLKRSMAYIKEWLR